MTTKEEQCLLALDYLTEPRGPTIRELKDYLRLTSVSLVENRLGALEAEGLVERIDGRYVSRGWRLTHKGRERVSELKLNT